MILLKSIVFLSRAISDALLLKSVPAVSLRSRAKLSAKFELILKFLRIDGFFPLNALLPL